MYILSIIIAIMHLRLVGKEIVAPSLNWNKKRYIFSDEKRCFYNVINPSDILKTQEGYIVRHAFERADGNLVVEVDERHCHIPIILTWAGEQYGALSAIGIQELVKDAVYRWMYRPVT